MNDFEIYFKQDDGTELHCNTVHIEEDVLRDTCGLKPKKENVDAGSN